MRAETPGSSSRRRPPPGSTPDPATGSSPPSGSSGACRDGRKRAVITALRDALKFPGRPSAQNSERVEVTVDMEYPMPGERLWRIWVPVQLQQDPGRDGHELQGGGTPLGPTRVGEQEPVREFIFEGRCTRTVVALTSWSGDRSPTSSPCWPSPAARVGVITRADRDTWPIPPAHLLAGAEPLRLDHPNHDTITPAVGDDDRRPWDDDIPGYEDTYAFDLMGQLQHHLQNDGTFSSGRCGGRRSAHRPPRIPGSDSRPCDGEGSHIGAGCGTYRPMTKGVVKIISAQSPFGSRGWAGTPRLLATRQDCDVVGDTVSSYPLVDTQVAAEQQAPFVTMESSFSAISFSDVRASFRRFSGRRRTLQPHPPTPA